MSQESDFSQDSHVGWIQWFCALEDHQFFVEIEEDFIKEKFNLYGFKNKLKKFDEALQMILGNNAPEEDEIESPKFLQVYQEATELYGLIHARYITTPQGLALTRERYLQGKYGQCPRVLCEKQNVIPIGICEDLKLARVKIYCPRCQDIYSPRKKFADVDGAFFGTSFPQLLLMTYPDIKPLFKKEFFQPTIFGFKIIENKENEVKKYEEKKKENVGNQEKKQDQESKEDKTVTVNKKNKKKKR